MWWIILIVFAVLCIFCCLFIRGADMKNRNEKYRAMIEDEQEKALSLLNKEKQKKSTQTSDKLK